MLVVKPKGLTVRPDNHFHFWWSQAVCRHLEDCLPRVQLTMQMSGFMRTTWHFSNAFGKTFIVIFSYGIKVSQITSCILKQGFQTFRCVSGLKHLKQIIELLPNDPIINSDFTLTRNVKFSSATRSHYTPDNYTVVKQNKWWIFYNLGKLHIKVLFSWASHCTRLGSLVCLTCHCRIFSLK